MSETETPVDDEAPPRRSEGSHADDLLSEAVDLVATARPMPLSASVMVNKDELLDLLQEAIDRLPDELKAARWLLKERDEYLTKVRREGDEMIAEAQARVAQMVQRSEVVKASQQRAGRVIERAEAQARQMRHEVEDYCDQKLASFEIILERTQRMVASGRTKLSGPASEAELDNGSEPIEAPPVFNQEG